MIDPREAFEAYLENGQGNTDHHGRYIGDPLDLWLAAWEEAQASLSAPLERAKPAEVEA